MCHVSCHGVCGWFQTVCVSQCHREEQVTCLMSLPTLHWVLFRPRHRECCRHPPSTRGKHWVSTALSPPSTVFTVISVGYSHLSPAFLLLFGVWQWNAFLVVSSHPDVIMDMFQAPTLLEDPFNNTSVLHAAEREAESAQAKHGEYTACWRVHTSIFSHCSKLKYFEADLLFLSCAGVNILFVWDCFYCSLWHILDLCWFLSC